MVGWNRWVSARTAANHKGKWGQCIRSYVSTGRSMIGKRVDVGKAI